MTDERCDSTLIIVANEDFRTCELPAGHDGPHREVSEWTDEEAQESRRWA
jgi:hypothetical protein